MDGWYRCVFVIAVFDDVYINHGFAFIYLDRTPAQCSGLFELVMAPRRRCSCFSVAARMTAHNRKTNSPYRQAPVVDARAE
jgi:hypothetical protein